MEGIQFLFGTGLIIFIGLLVWFKRNNPYEKSKHTRLHSQEQDLNQRNIIVSPSINSEQSTSITEINKLTEILLINQLGEELSFTRAQSNPQRTFYEVLPAKASMVGGQLIQAALPILETRNTFSELAKLAPHGLFAATADASTMSKFADGSLTTMVRDSKNKLVKHAGFKSVGELSKVSPLAVMNMGMQAAAIVSSQYYLEQINSQLANIDNQINHLIELHHEKELSVLLNSKKRLEEIIKRKNVGQEDIDEIRYHRNEVNKVFEHYKLTFERERQTIINQKLGHWFVGQRVKGFESSMQPLKFLLEVCYEANRLSLQAELAEISVRMKLNVTDSVLTELFEQLKTNVENSFSQNVKEKTELLFIPIHEKAVEVIGDGKNFRIFDKDQQKLLQQVKDKSASLVQELNKSKGNNILRQALENQNKKQDVLIMINKDKEIERLFIPVEP